LAIQRLLPYLQQIYQAYGSIKGNTELNSEVIKMLVEGNKIKTVSSGNETENFHFNNSIELKNVDFGYTSANNFALNNVSVKIHKGQKVGIIGSTGSGKSTLVDFLMGLLPFKEGEIIVDDIKLTENMVPSWQKIILHVPQSIFLSDGSIRSNIAFGERTNQISESRILDVIESSHLTEYIDSLPEGLETKVGERGLQLSGGQIQRIGIARSLYKGGDILILDEATNSLDKETEINIVKTIKKLDKKMTMIMIAHNLSTLEGCDMLIIMEKGKVIRTGSYNEVVTSKEFKKISGEMSGK
tara:strand:- start:1194 stop:2090 length:897 start_codon:yes stop_codon:yes gene_type:complete